MNHKCKICGENEEKAKKAPAREVKSVWNKRKKSRKATEKSKSCGENK